VVFLREDYRAQSRRRASFRAPSTRFHEEGSAPPSRVVARARPRQSREQRRRRQMIVFNLFVRLAVHYICISARNTGGISAFSVVWWWWWWWILVRRSILTRSRAAGGGSGGGWSYAKRAFRGDRGEELSFSPPLVVRVEWQSLPLAMYIYIGARRFDRRPLRVQSRTHSRRSAAPRNAGPTLDLALPPSAARSKGRVESIIIISIWYSENRGRGGQVVSGRVTV